VREIAQQLQGRPHAEPFLRELMWREFANTVIYHWPQSASEPMDRRFERMPWREDIEELQTWREGRTGIPLVDAGMRELWQTGFMHNRVRMLVASFLSKHLLIDWREGARWFEYTLLDADMPNNRMGWQWCAGSGVDAAPYFRIFNPVLQGQRFDPEGEYVRRWVPELGALHAKWIHRPWEAPAQMLEAAEVALGVDYPLPIIDLKVGRERALSAWAAIK
jgi:deoxyribodipyrimidine photo-lyase